MGYGPHRRAARVFAFHTAEGVPAGRGYRVSGPWRGRRSGLSEPVQVKVGDEVELRKPHACGANRWAVVRTGVDVRVRCTDCGRHVLMPRPQFEKAVRKVLRVAGR